MPLQSSAQYKAHSSIETSVCVEVDAGSFAITKQSIAKYILEFSGIRTNSQMKELPSKYILETVSRNVHVHPIHVQ
jgi:hypothetical protein